MKMVKKVIAIISLFLISVLIVSCKDKTYSLTLVNNITANVSDLNKIKEDEEVTLTVFIPEGKEIDYLLFNEEKRFIEGSTYTFLIKKDTNVDVYYKEEVVKYYYLVLPKEVKADVSDLEKLKKDTLVTLTVIVPLKKELKTLKINSLEVKNLDSNNKYSFTITENTKVEVTFQFKDNFKEATLLEMITFGLKVQENNMISEGTFNVDGDYAYLDDSGDFLFNFEFDEEANLLLADGNTTVNEFNFKYYYDSEYTYIKTMVDNKRSYDSFKGFYEPIKITNLDDFIEDEDLMFDDSIIYFLGNIVKIIILNLDNENLVNNIYFLKRGNEFKLMAHLTKEDLLTVRGLDDLYEGINMMPEFLVDFEMSFIDYKIDKAQVNLFSEDIFNLNFNLNYNKKEVTPLTNLSLYELKEENYKKIKVYLDESIYMNLEVESFIIDFILDNNLDIDSNYLENFNVEGIYLDEAFTTLFVIDDLNGSSDLTIYIKWLNID